MNEIQMVDLRSQYQDLKSDVDQAIQNVIDEGKFINGPAVQRFASDLQDWNRSKFVIPCANGTDGLQLAMMALGLKAGDEVIVPAFTYIATVEVIVLLGLTPIFVDVDYQSFNLDPQKVKDVITENTKLIVPVHLYGQCANMDEINNIAKANDLFVIEDLAQSLGAQYKGVKCGNIGDIGVTSFFPSKNLGCFGDGGAVITNNPELANRIKMIGNHGQKQKYYHEIIGVNSRLDSLQAAILIEKLKKLNEFENRRRQAADYYDQNLKDLSFIDIPFRELDSTHVFHQYTLKVRDGRRDALSDHLKNHRIPNMIYYPLPVPEQSAYSRFNKRKYSTSKKLCEEVISLPMHTHLSDEQLSFICKTIKKFG